MKKTNKKNEFEYLLGQACESYEIKNKNKNCSNEKAREGKNKKNISKK